MWKAITEKIDFIIMASQSLLKSIYYGRQLKRGIHKNFLSFAFSSTYDVTYIKSSYTKKFRSIEQIKHSN